MGIKNILWGIFIAVGLSGWGIIGRFVGVTGPWISAVILLSTTSTAMLMSWSKLSISEIPSTKAIMWLIATGTINGVAFVINADKMADKSIVAGTFLAMIYVFMVVIAPSMDCIFNKSIPSRDHFIGFALAIGAIYFFSK